MPPGPDGSISISTVVMGTRWISIGPSFRGAAATVACAGPGAASTANARLRLFHVPSAREVPGIEHVFDIACTQCALPPVGPGV